MSKTGTTACDDCFSPSLVEGWYSALMVDSDSVARSRLYCAFGAVRPLVDSTAFQYSTLVALSHLLAGPRDLPHEKHHVFASVLLGIVQHVPFGELTMSHDVGHD